MDKELQEKDRFFSVVKLLPGNTEVRKIALQYVESKLEFSLNNKTLLFNTHNEDNALLLSEIAKCLIISDVYAKIQYYEEKFNSQIKPKDLPTIYLLRRGDFPPFLDIFICPALVERQLKFMEECPIFMDTNAIAFRNIGKEDILNIAKITMNQPSKKKEKKKSMYVSCLISNLYGFLGMIYLYNACYNDEIYVDIIREKYKISKEEKDNEIKTLCLYGVRSTIFAVYNNQKSISTDLICSIAFYSKSINFPLLCVIKPPMGIMGAALRKLGFSHSYHAASDTLPESANVDIILDPESPSCNYESILDIVKRSCTHNNLLN